MSVRRVVWLEGECVRVVWLEGECVRVVWLAGECQEGGIAGR